MHTTITTNVSSWLLLTTLERDIKDDEESNFQREQLLFALHFEEMEKRASGSSGMVQYRRCMHACLYVCVCIYCRVVE